MNCPCLSQNTYEDCCGPIISGQLKAPTAEQLMRARYTAFTRADIDFIKRTLSPKGMKDFDPAATKKWATQSEWISLEILSTKKGSETDDEGVVEFVATYRANGKKIEHHETAEFEKNNKGEWLFVDGDSHTHEDGQGHHHHHPKVETYVREAPKVGRNDPCTCGSGKKFKKCCGAN